MSSEPVDAQVDGASQGEREGQTESPTPPATKPQLKYEVLRDVIELSLTVGQVLLQSGAQSKRVEQTVHQLGTALGANWLDIIVVPEGLTVTTSSGEEFRTRVRRVTHVGVNLSKVADIQQLCERVDAERIDRIVFRRQLEVIMQRPPAYPRVVIALLVGLACAAFSQLFGGDWHSFFVSFTAASIAMLVRQWLGERHFNPLICVIVTAFVAELLAGVSVVLGLLPYPVPALAASVLLLVPGVPLINASRDILRGYLVSGTARGISGLVISLCIAIGILLALQISGLRGLGPLPERQIDPAFWFILSGFWAGIAALGFSVLFNAPRRALFYCFLTGACGQLVRTALSSLEVPPLSAIFIGALSVGLVAVVFSNRLRVPAGLFSLPGAIPMVPGVSAFRAMLALITLTGHEISEASLGPSEVLLHAVQNFTTTGLTLATLAVGIALPSLITQRDKPVV